MKNLVTSTIVLGAICLFDAHSAKATLTESADPYFHLVRGGGGHGAARGGEGRGEEGRRDEAFGGNRAGSNGEGSAAEHNNVATDHPAVAEDRVHTLNDHNDNHLRNDDNLGYGEGWTGVDGGAVCTTDPNTGLTTCN